MLHDPQTEQFVDDPERAMYPAMIEAYHAWDASKKAPGEAATPPWAKAEGPTETLASFAARAAPQLAKMQGGQAAVESLGGPEDWAVFVGAVFEDEEAHPEPQYIQKGLRMAAEHGETDGEGGKVHHSKDGGDEGEDEGGEEGDESGGDYALKDGLNHDPTRTQCMALEVNHDFGKLAGTLILLPQNPPSYAWLPGDLPAIHPQIQSDLNRGLLLDDGKGGGRIVNGEDGPAVLRAIVDQYATGSAFVCNMGKELDECPAGARPVFYVAGLKRKMA